jgi:hypothetical protein
MDIKKMQIGLIEWFKFQQIGFQKFYKIENIAKKLFEEYYPTWDSNHAKYKIIYPLIRYGVVEFYGDNKFALSPTCALYNDNYILTCNLSDTIKQKVLKYQILDSNIGIVVLKNTSNSNQILKDNLIILSKFSFGDLLMKVLSFEDIIKNWNKNIVIDTIGFQYYADDYKWKNITGPIKNGVYRKSSEVYSQRILKINEDDWYLIPLRDKNIDAFNIAVCWTISNGLKSVKISYNNSNLKIENINFPVILERILFLNTLLNGKFEIDVFNDKYQRNYYLSNNEFKILNNLFNNKISQ